MLADPRTEIQRVKDHVRARVIRAEWAEGARIDDEELRRQTGATYRAVWQALGELAREGLLNRRQRLGTFVAKGVARAGTSPLPAVRSVAILSSMSLDQVKQVQFSVDILEGIRFALAQPQRIEFCTHPPRASKAVNVLPTVDAELLRSLVQGVVAIEANHTGRLNDIARAGLPVVAMDFHHFDAAFDSVYVDHDDAGYQATAHLVALGHRRIAFVGERFNPNTSDPTWQERMAGYLRAMAWSGGETPSPLVLGGPRDTSMLARDLPEFHRRRQPTAYVLATSGWLSDVIRILQPLGVECPRDVSLTCADASQMRFGSLAVSFARADYEQAGRIAAQLIASRIACRAMPPVRISLPVTFIPGDTSQALAGGAG